MWQGAWLWAWLALISGKFVGGQEVWGNSLSRSLSSTAASPPMCFLEKHPDRSISAMELCPQGTPRGLG